MIMRMIRRLIRPKCGIF